ncbi:hypothetical protein [Rhizobium leguminosarum]|uniref:hypothetical protein n=1 Tax=Rhizobium leguminosarum TaxID=384 RepID=UPI001C9132FD|nr:hypothetical protein [Rhizobium leguminosarum]MBY2987508.1 hypothetical protein [Rhizobium leguminosarum]
MSEDLREDNQVPPPSAFTLDDRKESVKTYIEQTKLLVTLASAFIVAPVVLTSAINGEVVQAISTAQFWTFVGAEVLFILSIMAGYLVLGTIAGSQVRGEHWVYRPATVVSSWIQIGTYVAGLIVLITYSYFLMAAPTAAPTAQIPAAADASNVSKP